MKHVLHLLTAGVFVLNSFYVAGQSANNPPANSFKDNYSSGTYLRCSYDANLSEAQLSGNANYEVKAGRSIRIQASHTQNSAIGGFSGGSFHASVDPNYNLTGCGAVGTIVWDNVYSGDGSITRELRPVDYQLYPRKSNNYGDVVFSGSDNGNHSTITFVTIKKDFSNVYTSYNNTTVNIVNKRFYFSLPIHAELSEYFFLYYLDNQSGSPVMMAQNVVCGDAYIISGQSNASTLDISVTEYNYLTSNFGEGTAYGRYSRSYGSIYTNATGNWGVSRHSDPPILDMKNHVGAWGLYMQYRIQETYGIPTCLLNGAVGGTKIENHLDPTSPPDEHFYDPATFPPNGVQKRFALLNTRVYNAGLENKIRGIFWWQGDAGNPCISSCNYAQAFTPLYNLWEKYYPGFSQAYIVQVPSWVQSEINMREVSESQRQMGSIFPKTTVMSANGIGYHRTEPAHEIHHQDQGYIALGTRLFNLLEKNVYGKTTGINDLTPPNILSAGIYGNQITLHFDQNIYSVSGLGDNLSDILSVIRFNNEISPFSSTVIKSSPSISGQYLTFNVNSPAGISSVSYAGYIPGTSPANIDNVGCYIRNSKNIGALSFHNIPVNFIQPRQVSDGNETGIYEVADATGLMAYPNPFTGDVTITGTDNRFADKITISDVSGRVILELKNEAKNRTFDFSHLKEGLYIVQVEVTGQTLTTKLIKSTN